MSLKREVARREDSSRDPAGPGMDSTLRVGIDRIFVLDDRWALLGEKVLREGCPVRYVDVRRSVPADGLRDRISFVNQGFAITPFHVDDLWFLVVTRDVPRMDDREAIGTLVSAVRIHVVPNLAFALARREALLRQRERELDALADILSRREQQVSRREREMEAESQRVRAREDSVRERETRLLALRDVVSRIRHRLVSTPPPSEPSFYEE